MMKLELVAYFLYTVILVSPLLMVIFFYPYCFHFRPGSSLSCFNLLFPETLLDQLLNSTPLSFVIFFFGAQIIPAIVLLLFNFYVILPKMEKNNHDKARKLKLIGKIISVLTFTISVLLSI